MELIADLSPTAFIRSSSDASTVEMWTGTRIPFEPKGQMLVARNVLRNHLKQLNGEASDVFAATFASLDSGYYDAENVLLYNVGTSAFPITPSKHWYYLRSIEDVPEASAPGFWKYYHRYAFVAPGRLVPPTGVPVMDLRFCMESLGTSCKPHDYWWAARSHVENVEIHTPNLSGKFFLSVKIVGPRFPQKGVVLIKPLFDGIISALHCDDTLIEGDDVCRLLSSVLGAPPVSVCNALRSTDSSILGARCVVSPYRGFVKWNPADEACFGGELIFNTSDEKSWKVRASISAIEIPASCEADHC